MSLWDELYLQMQVKNVKDLMSSEMHVLVNKSKAKWNGKVEANGKSNGLCAWSEMENVALDLEPAWKVQCIDCLLLLTFSLASRLMP